MRKDSLEQWLSSLDEGVDEAAKKLAIGAAIVEDIRLDVFNKTGYRCSAGISYNKVTKIIVKKNKQFFCILLQFIWFSDSSKVGLRFTQAKSSNNFTKLGCAAVVCLLAGEKSKKFGR